MLGVFDDVCEAFAVVVLASVISELRVTLLSNKIDGQWKRCFHSSSDRVTCFV